MPAAVRYSANVYIAIAVVVIAPIPCALIGDWVQHTFLSEVYWAVPISVASFYTPLWWALCLLWLGVSAKPRHWSLNWSIVGAIVSSGARLVYWWPSPRDFERGTVAALIEARLSDHAVSNWSVICLVGITYVCLYVAAKQVLSAHRLEPRTTPHPMKSNIARTAFADVSVVCVGRGGWVETESALLPERRTSAVAFHRRWWDGARFFHRDGACYEIASATTEQPLAPLSEILSHTFYNPRLTVRYEYRSVGAYELDTLKKALNEAVDNDDDILAQFHEADEIKARLRLARSFDDVVDVLRFAAMDAARPGVG
jgi:hypothetical protein